MSRQTLDEYLQESRREIAIFMGATLIPGSSPEFDQYLVPKRGCVSVSNLLYDRSMEWAVEVVEKFEALGLCFKIERKYAEVTGIIAGSKGLTYWFSGYTHDSKLDAIFNGIAELAKSYNLRSEE